MGTVGKLPGLVRVENKRKRGDVVGDREKTYKVTDHNEIRVMHDETNKKGQQ